MSAGSQDVLGSRMATAIEHIAVHRQFEDGPGDDDIAAPVPLSVCASAPPIGNDAPQLISHARAELRWMDGCSSIELNSHDDDVRGRRRSFRPRPAMELKRL